MKHHLLFLLAGTWIAAPALAQEYCLDSASEAAYEACLERRFQQADQALNRIYQEALRAIDQLEGTAQEVQPDAWRAALREAQRAWIAFKEAECDGLALHENWEWWSPDDAVVDCRIRVTDARASELAARYGVSAEGTYADVIRTDAIGGLERRTLERFGAAIERHDWDEVRSMFDEDGYLEQREAMGLEDDQILLETLGFENNLRTGPDDDAAFQTRLNRIAEFVVTDAAYDDSRSLTVKGFVVLRDGSEVPFTMYWAERMNGGIEVVVPVG